MAYEYLDVTYQDPVATILLNRPDKRNALSRALRSELVSCLGEIGANARIRAVVLSGRGTVFSAGFDLSELTKSGTETGSADEFDRAYHIVVMNFTKPLIAAVNGPAVGGGFDLATMCDVRIAAETATFSHPEIKFGAPTLYKPLKEAIGASQAALLCLSGLKIDAAEAYRIGLVSRVFPAESLMEEALNLAQSISEAPLSALCNVKKQIIGQFQFFDFA